MYIIDGQQRISTIVILLSAFKEMFDDIGKKLGDKKGIHKSQDIIIKYIGRYDEDANELKLFLGETDREFFKEYIQCENKEYATSKTSHELIKKAYEYFISQLKSEIEDKESNDAYETLKDLYGVLSDKIVTMLVETDDLEEAFIIFETLNSRGKQLETSDLLKNYLFRMASSGEELEKVQSNWKDTISALNGIDVTKFLRHYWNSQYEFVREKALYRSLKKSIDTKTKCKVFSDKFREMAYIYRCLVDPNEYNDIENQEVVVLLESLEAINTSSFYPIILAMYGKKYSDKDIIKILKTIESLYYRNCVVCGYVANKYEIEFSQIAHQISISKEKSIESIQERIKKLIVSDEVFTTNFMELSVSTKIAKILLRELNDRFEKEVQIKKDNIKIHLEHIMPKKLNTKWLINEDDHKQYLNYLGNLTLLGEEYNKQIQNFEFKKKKEKYAVSKIQLTKDISKYKNWSKNDILDRQKKLCNTALSIWKIE